jgi:hypothetical protein
VSTPHVRQREIKRILPPGQATAVLTASIGGQTSVTPTTTSYGIAGAETTTSQKGSNWMAWQQIKRRAANRGRPVDPNVAKNLSRGDLGNEFETVKQYIEMDPVRPVNLDIRQGIYRYQYSGPWLARQTNASGHNGLYKAVPGDLRSRMISKGTTAIARTIPTNPVAGAAQFIGELREGLPSVPGISAFKKPGPTGIADEYLNFEFGIKPILSDLRKFGEAARTSSDVIEQLKRDSGRLVRRRYTFPVERTITTEVASPAPWGGYPSFRLAAPNCYAGSPGPLIRTREETYEYWFSGAYTYVYVTGDSAYDRARAAEQRLAKLFGTRISPELLWELTPWSWAADWVGNMGDVIHNLSAFSNDSLVLRWGYLMCHYTCRDTYSADNTVILGSGIRPQTQTYVTDVKKRIRATPYGFGLDTDKFTTRQWAILGALGMSRGSRML